MYKNKKPSSLLLSGIRSGRMCESSTTEGLANLPLNTPRIYCSLHPFEPYFIETYFL